MTDPPAAPLRRAAPARYLVNTALSFAVNLGLTALLHEGWAVAAETAYAVALATVFAMNFGLFRYYVFDGRTSRPGVQLGLFAAVSAAFRAGEYVVFLLVHTGMGAHYLATIVGVQGVTFVLKYFVYGRWVFNRRRGRRGGGGAAGDTMR